MPKARIYKQGRNWRAKVWDWRREEWIYSVGAMHPLAPVSFSDACKFVSELYGK